VATVRRHAEAAEKPVLGAIPAAQNISYTTLAAGDGGPIAGHLWESSPRDSTLSELRLFQDGSAGGEGHREFSIKATSYSGGLLNRRGRSHAGE
jgi:hypothetical protein